VIESLYHRPSVCLSPNLVAFVADYVKVVEDTRILNAAEMYAEESSFSDISLMAILAIESVTVRHSVLAIEHLTNNQP